MIFCIHLKWLIKKEGHLERASALRKNLREIVKALPLILRFKRDQSRWKIVAKSERVNKKEVL